MKFKRVLTFVMCVAMVFALCPSSYASPGSDFYSYSNQGDADDKWKTPPQEGNTVLLKLACDIAQCLRDDDYVALSKFVHPKLGVRFTIYSYVEFDKNLVFTAKEIKKAESDQTIYTWGYQDGSGFPIEMTMADYLDEVVYDKDYVNATRFGVDAVVQKSIDFNNINEAYPGCHFVDMYHHGHNPEYEAIDWGILRLVFSRYKDEYYLVGIINHMHTM